MYKIEYIGSWKSIPEAAAAIYDSDIPKLEAMLQNGLNLMLPFSSANTLNSCRLK